MFLQSKKITSLSTKNESTSYRMSTCIIAALFFTYEFFQFNSINTIGTSLMGDFHLNSLDLSKLSACYLYGVIFSFIPAGLLLDNTRNKRLIALFFLFSLSNTLLFSISPNFFYAKLFRFFMGLGHGIAFLGCFRFVYRLFPIRQQPLMMGVNISIGLLGGILAQSPLAALVSWLGWRHAMQFTALIGFFCWLLLCWKVRELPIVSKQHKVGLRNLLLQLRTVIAIPQNWICALYATLANAPGFVLGAVWGNIYLSTVYSISILRAGNITALLFLGTIIGAPLIGSLARDLSSMRSLMRYGGILSLCLVILISQAPHLPLLLITLAFFFLGITMSTQSLSYPLISASNSAKSNSTAMGLSATLIMGSGSLTQLIFGGIMQLQTSHAGTTTHYKSIMFQYAFLFIIFCYGLSIAVTYLIKTYDRRKEVSH